MPKITIYQKPTCTTCRQVYNAAPPIYSRLDAFKV